MACLFREINLGVLSMNNFFFFLFFPQTSSADSLHCEEGVVVIVFVVSLLWGFAWISQKKKKKKDANRNTVNLVHLQEPNHA